MGIFGILIHIVVGMFLPVVLLITGIVNAVLSCFTKPPKRF